MKARIEILTRTLQKTSHFSAVGELERIGDGARIVYPIDGDVSTLEIFPSHAILKRRGENNFDAEFSASTPTLFHMSLQGASADLPIIPRVYKSFISDEIFLRLTYDLDTGSDLQKFYLKISVRVLSE